ncbi:MAG: polysaccharide biosynthesis tyrosine autokinase [Bacteroidota bacterium]
MSDFQGFAQESSINVQKLLGKIISKWYLILISLAIAIGVAYGLLRYATEIYQSSTILLNKELSASRGGGKNNQTDLLDGNVYFSSGRTIKEEIDILTSSSLLEEVIRKLDFRVTYIRKGKLKDKEQFPSSPIQLSWDTASTVVPVQVEFELQALSREEYSLVSESESWENILVDKTFRFGEYQELNGFRFKVDLMAGSAIGKEYLFFINRTRDIVRDFSSRLRINERGKSILNIRVDGPTPQKDVVFLEAYVNTIVQKNLEEKNQNATNTIDFINEQLDILYDSLRYADAILGSINLNNRDVALGSGYLLEQMDELLDGLADLEITQRYIVYLEEYITELPNEEVVLPTTLGVSSPQLSGLVQQYMSSGLANRQLELEEYVYNPMAQIEQDRNDRELEVVRQAILESISRMKESNSFKIQQQRGKVDQLKSKAENVLREEWDFLYRQKIIEFNQGLYNLLLQRRIEASIARASTTGDYQILQEPSFRSRPISPDKQKYYIMTLFIGMMLPVGLILVKELLNQKVSDIDVLKQTTKIPYLGMVGHNKDNSNLVLFDKPKSAIAESFRSIRSNIQFFGADGTSKVFVITSSISNEGKTFCSINLASVFSFSQKRTILIGADLRKPKIYTDFGLHNDNGLSNYLAGVAELDDIVQSTHYQYLDVISAGPIPPNPSELLMSDRLVELVSALQEQYDFIVIDSPPLGIVTDASILMAHADRSFFIVRQNYTPKATLRNMNALYESGKVENVSVIFNDARQQRFGYYQYGYGYGYGNGYYVEKNGKKGRVRSALGKLFRI